MSFLNTPPSTFTFRHRELGSLEGLISPTNVVQFRAVPYARIPARFQRSVIVDADASAKRDCTKSGYACPQVFSEDDVGGGAFPGEEKAASSEFECLIAQLNIPLVCLESIDKSPNVPVLVYIHGGGFVLGKIDEQHNTALIVGQSIEDSQPIISVSIQYRLGALGYLHTSEPGNSNLALNDQRNALIWIQRYIRGFGGDANRITVFGESGGSMSICTHMLATPPVEGPLFHKVILMSGVLGPMTAPLPRGEAERLYEALLVELDIEERGAAALAQLREVDVQSIVDATAKLSEDGHMWLPVQEEEWFGRDAQDLTWDKIPELVSKCDWVDVIVLGTTSFEGTTLVSAMAGVTPVAFLAGITDQLGEESAALVSRAYGIISDMDQNLFVSRALRWIGDVVFDAPSHALARQLAAHSEKKVYRYVFDVRNPFIGSPFYQQPHHWVDIYFVFKTYQFRYPAQRLVDISTRHAQFWINITNGATPWTEYKYTGLGNEVIMVADENSGWTEQTVAENEAVSETTWKRCEQLWDSWDDKRGTSFQPMKTKAFERKKLV
ncbi:alpha/beta-hydrolase [Plenodomus tracheiphilus IPT5]|uniref:Carboxylic ester hydrolase n=1 Tax=Plenodomus tracheiphilus IPT5 TaxID=1408161 RepID=A0A6A7APL0_9PLEO|nr:alpha/beta-hydrolase [Plenodomus tracheiphilus IPT5]